MATQETFDRTIAMLKDAKYGHAILDVQVGVCLGAPSLASWTRSLGHAKLILRGRGFIVGQAESYAFAIVGNGEIVEAATPELALAIAGLESRKAELLEEG